MSKNREGFIIRPYRMKRLKSYAERYSRDNLNELFDDNVAGPLRLQGFHVIDSPRSVYRVDKLYEALEHYSPSKSRKVDVDQDVKNGISLAYSVFAKPKERPELKVMLFNAQTISKITSNPGGSAGLTNYGVTKAQSQTRALERGLQTLHSIKAPEPCLAFKRTQFNDKTRLVWGYPYAMTAIEGVIAYPLLQEFKKGDTPMAFAMTSGALGTKLRVASYHKKYAYSLDMSQFDSSISAYLIRVAFNILRTWFDLDDIEPCSGKSVGAIFNLIEDYFIHTPIVMPDLNLYLGKRHGVPSGSYFTQIVDSIVNTVLAGTVSSKFHLDVSGSDIFVLGDDLLMWSNRFMDLDKISRYCEDVLGIHVHGKEKSAIYNWNEPVHYLGRDWDQGLPTLNQEDIVKRMVFPESYRRYSQDAQTRARQVRLLLLSYASVYKEAWPIASRVIANNPWSRQGGEAVDRLVYSNTGNDVEPNHMTGLVRFMMKYVMGEEYQKNFPTTALQYWL